MESKRGIQFPCANTTPLIKDIMAVSTAAMADYVGEEATEAAQSIRKESDWRFKYSTHAVRHVELATRSSQVSDEEEVFTQTLVKTSRHVSLLHALGCVRSTHDFAWAPNRWRKV